MTLYKHCLMTAVSDSNRSYETAEFLDDLENFKIKARRLSSCFQSYGILAGHKWEPLTEERQVFLVL